MSNELFTEVSSAQQETVSGGRRLTVNIGGSFLFRARDTSASFTSVLPDGTAETQNQTDSSGIEADATTGNIVSSTPDPDFTSLPAGIQALLAGLLGL
ncbi:CTB family bacteriocin [Nodularia chucula]|uniref:CTB family bacteriocin n=1 Tax=Nodularia chucula TaxID=3093667 RepID=UPI0039C61156